MLTDTPKPMTRVLVRDLDGQWLIARYCVDEGEPGMWLTDYHVGPVVVTLDKDEVTEWRPLPA